MGPEATANINSNLQKIQILQEDFNKKNRISKTKIMNYNPVLARWKFEETTTDLEKNRFRQYETFQVETTLRERNKTAKSSVKYLIGEDRLVYNELFPDEPFDVVLERGLAYRKQHGSKELLRETAELSGWKKITNLLTSSETEVGTKAVVISGPGLIEDTNYNDNFVDIYEAAEDAAGKRHIKMTRYSSSLDYEQYWNKLRNQDINYFQESNMPIDAWLLSHPIIFPPADKRTTDEIFDGIFEKRRESMSEADFQKLLVMCMPVINYYIGVLTRKNYDPQSMALSWNAVLQKNDIVRKAIQGATPLPQGKPLFNGNVATEVNWLGHQVIETVAAGCGASEGFEIKDGALAALQNPLAELLKNSVAKHSPTIKDLLKESDKKKWFICPSCGYKADGPVGNSCPKDKGGCGLTKEQYAKSGGKVC